MLINSKYIQNQSVYSIQTGRPLAKAVDILVDPRDLSVPAIFVHELNSKSDSLIVHTSDIREVNMRRMIVNDYEAIMDHEDLPRLQEIIDFDFGIVGISVETKSGKKLGKVSDAALETKSGWRIAKIYVTQSLLRNIHDAELVIDFSQIVETTPEKIVVKDSFSSNRERKKLAIEKRKLANRQSLAKTRS